MNDPKTKPIIIQRGSIKVFRNKLTTKNRLKHFLIIHKSNKFVYTYNSKFNF